MREISTSWLGENSVRIPSLTSRSTFTDTDCSGWAENFSVLSGYVYSTIPPSARRSWLYDSLMRFSERGSMGKMRTLYSPCPAYSSSAGSRIRRTMSS
ncbi:MAG: hypothetical protein AB2L07_04425 [Thermoanaerobaculaceae bacterium]